MRLFKSLRLATRDYVHEWQMSGCFVLALAAVLGPMLVLFGLKFGIVGGMLEQLIENPANREVRPVGSGRFDLAWFDGMRQRSDVAAEYASTSFAQFKEHLAELCVEKLSPINAEMRGLLANPAHLDAVLAELVPRGGEYALVGVGPHEVGPGAGDVRDGTSRIEGRPGRLDGLGLERGVRMLGMSYGGWIAGQHALSHPDRLEHLVLIAPAATVAWFSPDFIKHGLLCAIPHKHFVDRMVRWVLGSASGGTPAQPDSA